MWPISRLGRFCRRRTTVAAFALRSPTVSGFRPGPLNFSGYSALLQGISAPYQEKYRQEKSDCIQQTEPRMTNPAKVVQRVFGNCAPEK
jgi:hypothetical protein